MPASQPNPPPELSRLTRKSLKQGVIDQIYAAIVRGELTAGQQVTELGLARQLGVSQPTIREALIELEHQGFVQKRSAHKTSITLLTERDINEIYLVRATLEALVVELLASSTTVNLEQCEAACQRMAEAAERGHTSEFYQADLDFHRCLWRATENRIVMDMLEQLVSQLFAFGIIQHAVRERAALLAAVEEHGQLLRLIRAGDRDAARKLMEASLRHARAEDTQL